MAVQQAPSGIVAPSADVVSKAFVYQYYLILHQSPEHVHQFYQDSSKLGRPEANGFMGVTSTMKAINEKILSLDYGELKAEITTVDAQDSHNGGFLVLVTGYLTGRDNVRRKFTQTFFLAPQDKGYFVLNDMFRYVEDPQLSDANSISLNDAEPPLAIEQGNKQDQENVVLLPVVEVEQEEVEGQDEVDSPGNEDVVVEETLVPEVDEIPVDPERTAESDDKYEDVPKKSYASIVKVMKEGATVQISVSSPAPLKSTPKVQELPLTAPTSHPSIVEDQISSLKVTENVNGQENESDGLSVYLKGLSMNVTYPQIESECSKFGPIKSGGIQIRSQKGFCFGFVEYEERSAAVAAIEASPINIGGRHVVIEPKKSTIRVNARERFPSGRPGGFRTDGPRGRGNYGGNRGYSRGEMNRPDFGNRNGNRGWYPHRGDVGYQRADRPHRSFDDGELPKNMAPRVPATA
ncbi:hypothetical protein SAY87_006669 [Trapa incisa]|uniref:Uncharacterized protein n=1 Tax=Trapa incisa TaxID=236973 RepID=A0AAN7PYT4_9MYRT|nr:hypothetical protein SAY87_006669 [Trapa incisa]